MDHTHTIEGDKSGTPIMKLQIVLHVLKNEFEFKKKSLVSKNSNLTIFY